MLRRLAQSAPGLLPWLAVVPWTRKRLIFSALTVGTSGAALMTATSCLPDLVPATVSALETGPPSQPTSLPAVCGDGVVDLDAGEECDPGEAGAFGCEACKVGCEDGGLRDDASSHCYFRLSDNPSYEQAVLACENAGAHLVTFVSEDEYQRVFAWRRSPFWVGLKLDIAGGGLAYEGLAREPGWSRNCTGCYAHLDAGESQFPRIGGRDAGIGSLGCVGAAASNEPWYTVPCDLSRFLPAGLSVVCEREPRGFTAHPCIGGTCATARTTGSRYLYIPIKVTAQEALDGCRAIGAKLVVFETREEREELAKELLSVLPQSPTPQMWVGLTRATGSGIDASSSGNWAWANGAPMETYSLEWGDNEPKVGGWAWMYLPASLYDTQLLHSDDGTSKLPYVCEL